MADTIYRHRNVSQAAVELGLSQSAVSHALRRMRSHFDDPMFVRTTKGVAPTELARRLQNDISDVVQKAKALSARGNGFDPLTARGRIVISTTDYFELAVMSHFQSVLAKESPNIQVSIRPTLGELPKRDLEEGKVDLAVAGFYRDLPEGFFQAKLFNDSFASATRQGHPLIREALGVEDFFSAKHALITMQGDFADRLSKPNQRDRTRKIPYGSFSFSAMAWVLQDSDMILTAPLSLLKSYSRFFPIRIWPCPVETSPLEIRMVWHEQTNKTNLGQWFRKKLKQYCLEKYGKKTV